MKISHYNFFWEYSISTGGKSFIIFNSFRGTITEVDYATFSSLKNGNTPRLNNKELKYMLQQGVLTNSSCEINDYLEYFDNTKSVPTLEIQFFISSACNFACPYCYLNHNVKKGGIISSKKLDSFLLWLLNELLTGKYSDCRLELSGGEPLVAKKLFQNFLKEIDVIKKHTGKDINLHLITNGYLFDDQVISEMIRQNAYIQITLDGLPQSHNKRRYKKKNKGETFEKIWDNIIKIINKGGEDLLHIRMNVDKENCSDIEELACMCSKAGIKNFELAWVVFNSSDKPDYNKQFSKIDYENEVVDFWKQIQPYGYKSTIDDFMRLGTCMLYRKYGYVVDNKLDVFKCDDLMQNNDYKIGYINDQGKLIVNNINAYNNFVERNPKWFPDCIICKLLPICGTGCPARALKYNNDINKSFCETSEERIYKRVYNYLITYNQE